MLVRELFVGKNGVEWVKKIMSNPDCAEDFLTLLKESLPAASIDRGSPCSYHEHVDTAECYLDGKVI